MRRQLFPLEMFPVSERRSLVHAEDIKPPKPVPRSTPISEGVELLAERVFRARYAQKPVVLGMGAHAIKLGLASYLIDLVQRRVITAVAMNGATAYHDMELAMFGETSEDVAEALPAGKFGMTEESAAAFNEAANLAYTSGLGLGDTLARAVMQSAPPDRVKTSLLGVCAQLQVPVTIHLSFGADVFMLSPLASGAAFGETSLRDFRMFCGTVAELAGGVYINLGSAVMMPEVFLKAVSVAINTGADLKGLTTANLDMLDHYRPRVNVIERIPGRGIDIRGRHEDTIPALQTRIVAKLAKAAA